MSVFPLPFHEDLAGSRILIWVINTSTTFFMVLWPLLLLWRVCCLIANTLFPYIVSWCRCVYLTFPGTYPVTLKILSFMDFRTFSAILIWILSPPHSHLSFLLELLLNTCCWTSSFHFPHLFLFSTSLSLWAIFCFHRNLLWFTNPFSCAESTPVLHNPRPPSPRWTLTLSPRARVQPQEHWQDTLLCPVH